MREIQAADITQTIRTLCLSACCEIGQDVLDALEAALARERSPFGRNILRQLIENDRLACARGMPICQDTGMAVVFADVGQDVHIAGGAFEDAIHAGVRTAYREGCFRNSVLDPLTRLNTGDNTPAVVHTRLVPGDRLALTVAPKGFGSENMSRLGMLTPAQGIEGLKAFVVETVRLAGANPCPPVVVGVGIGSTAEGAMLLAKRGLLRDIGSAAPSPAMAALEAELLARVNALGIGPQGLGGDTTALAVHCAQAPTHLAGLPVAVNMQCHAARHKHAVL